METVVKIKGKEYRIYKLYFNGHCELAFFAYSERSAKIKVSKFCLNSVTLYKEMGGVYLCDEFDKKLAVYSPFFFRWNDCDRGVLIG